MAVGFPWWWRKIASGLVLLGAGVAALPLAVAEVRAQKSTIVETDGGTLEGVARSGIVSFKGIPFAAPPVGDLRWREPQAPARWSGTRRAGDFGKACIQKPGLSAENGGDPGPLGEDCLTLNVWTPTLKASAKLPVIVWIHGGAYIFGAGSVPIYDGARMAKKGAAFVSLNYRLGSLGFFAHPALDKAQAGGPYNFGLLDQIAALKWVQRNIAKFGGDPGNVTIMGQSAGAKSVLAHFSSPLSRGLFHKAIAQSVYVVPDAKLEKAREIAGKLASAVGLNGANASLEDLRKVPAEKFGEIVDKDLGLGPVPIVGDAVLPRSIENTFQAGGEAKAPLIIGNTSDDASVVAAFGFSPEEIMKKLGVAGFGLKLLYPGVSADKLPRQALRDVVFTMNSRWVADRHAKRAPTWRYYFDYVANKDKPTQTFGVPHGADVPYALDTLGPGYSRADRALAKKVSGYFYEFAKTGKPASDGAPKWDDDRAFRDRTLIMGPEKIELRRNFMRARLDVLIGVSKIVDTLFGK